MSECWPFRYAAGRCQQVLQQHSWPTDGKGALVCSNTPHDLHNNPGDTFNDMQHRRVSGLGGLRLNHQAKRGAAS